MYPKQACMHCLYVCVYIYAPCWAKVKQLFMRCREPCCSLRSVHMACSNETGSGSGPPCTFQIKMLFQASFTQHLPTTTVARGKRPLEATLWGFTNPCVLCKEHPHHLPSEPRHSPLWTNLTSPRLLLLPQVVRGTVQCSNHSSEKPSAQAWINSGLSGEQLLVS